MNEEEQAQPPQEASSAPAPEGVAAPEISRRVGSILDAVEREAARLREEARVEAGVYLDNARQRADGLVAERQRRIGQLSDELIAKSEAVIARLDDAAPVRQGFENLVRALGDAAERLANEAEGGASEFTPPPFGTASTTPPPQQAAPPEPDQYRAAAASHPQIQAPQRDHYAQQPANPDQYGSPAPYAPAEQQYGGPPAPQQSQGAYPHPSRTPAAPGWRDDGSQAATSLTNPPAGSQQQPAQDPGWHEQDEARMVAIQMAASGATRGGVRAHLHRALGLADTGAVLDEVFGPGSGEDAQVPWTSSRR